MRGIMRGRRILLTLTAITGLVTAAAPALAQRPSPHGRRSTGGDAAAAVFRSRPGQSGRGEHLLHDQQRLRLGGARARHDLERDARPGLHVRRLPDRLRRAADQRARPDQRRAAADGERRPGPDRHVHQSATASAIRGCCRRTSTSRACNASLPPAAVPQTTIDHIRASLTGQQSPMTGMCATKSDGTRIARGYITVDDTTSAPAMTPADPGYFAGIATNQNICGATTPTRTTSAGSSRATPRRSCTSRRAPPIRRPASLASTRSTAASWPGPRPTIASRCRRTS